MDIKILGLSAALLLSTSWGAIAQDDKEARTRTSNFPEMRKIENTKIAGAPILSQPQRIDGSKLEIRTEKHGLIYPAFFDWNGDGKKDLLLGEFETGETGSNIKVYLNEGTDAKPRYTGEWFYATDVKGDTITNHQWCCIGIHPRMVDLDQDGYVDIVSGQYFPGLVSWWRGSKDGFLPRQFIEQEGYAGEGNGDNGPGDDPASHSYWNYTSVDFADFDGDGLLDMFVGGSGGLRVALNTGTKEKPRFGNRNYLYHVDGTRLGIASTDEKVRQYIFKTYMTPVDWDGDGVLDILLTYEYTREGHNAVEFLRGVRTDKGLRFEKAVPLFTEAEGRKALPGCQPMITMVDYNNDGVKDIVLGISIPTINGFEAAPEIAWEWVRNTGIQTPGKDAGRAIEYSGGVEGTIARIEKEPAMKDYYLGKLDDYKYLTLRHRGYVFVMYGEKNPVAAKAGNVVKAEEPKSDLKESVANSEQVKVEFRLPESIKAGEEVEAEVVFSFKEGWHGYTDSEANRALGFIPTSVYFEFPGAVHIKGEMLKPKHVYAGANPVYEGNNVVFRQKIVCPASLMEKNRKPVARAQVSYQVCDENMCMPPVELTLEKEMNIVNH